MKMFLVLWVALSAGHFVLLCFVVRVAMYFREEGCHPMWLCHGFEFLGQILTWPVLATPMGASGVALATGIVGQSVLQGLVVAMLLLALRRFVLGRNPAM